MALATCEIMFLIAMLQSLYLSTSLTNNLNKTET